MSASDFFSVTLFDLRVLLIIPALLLVKFLVNFIYTFAIRPSRSISSYGKWSIITGATDGIGLAIATELAKRGQNLILISRTASRLSEAASSIRSKFNVDIKEIAVDFNNFDDKAKSLISSVLSSDSVGSSLGILVNNVGVSYDYPLEFHLLDQDRVKALIDLNLVSTTGLTHLVLPYLLSRRRGLIVNVSSAASLFPNPLLSQYSAAKCYIDQLSRSLDAEYSSSGITVQHQNPLYVSTKLAKMRPSITCPTTKQYAKAAVDSFGYPSGFSSPYWAHALQLSLMSLIPSSLIASQIKSLHIGIKKRALKKKEREQGQGQQAQ